MTAAGKALEESAGASSPGRSAKRKVKFLAGLVSLIGLVACREKPDRAELRVFYATQPGAEAMDVAEGGGNPFAGALAELLNRKSLDYANLASELPALTGKKSFMRQRPHVPIEPLDWRIRPVSTGERRIGLIVVFSEYPPEGDVFSLPGAKKDAIRLADAFRSAGFETRVLPDPRAAQWQAALQNFSEQSVGAAVAAIYVTGHGAEIDGDVYLLPGDYPFAEGKGALARHAVALTEFAAALRADRINLLFYGGCRDNPF